MAAAILRRCRCLSGRSVNAVLLRVAIVLLLGLAAVRFFGGAPHSFESDDDDDTGTGVNSVQRNNLAAAALHGHDAGAAAKIKTAGGAPLQPRAVPAPPPVKADEAGRAAVAVAAPSPPAAPAPSGAVPNALGAQGKDEDGYEYPVKLELDLPREVLEREDLKDPAKMRRQYGFNLALSNRMSLDRDIPDRRSAECRQLDPLYPHDMPKTSVIIIFYNEALSTLLRNVVSMLNRTPIHLLGEIILVDDNSTLPELKYLPAHLAKLPKKVRGSGKWCGN